MSADIVCKIIIAETYIVRKDTCFTWMYEKNEKNVISYNELRKRKVEM